MRASSRILLPVLLMIPLADLSAQTNPPIDYDWVDRSACDVFGGIEEVGDVPFTCRFVEPLRADAGQQVANDGAPSE